MCSLFSTQNYLCFFPVPFTWPVPSQTGIYCGHLRLSTLKVSIGAEFYIRWSLTFFSSKVSNFHLQAATQCGLILAFCLFKNAKRAVWNFTNREIAFPSVATHAWQVHGAAELNGQVNAGLFKQNEGLSYFLGSLLLLVQSLSLPTREMTFRVELLEPNFPRNTVFCLYAAFVKIL